MKVFFVTLVVSFAGTRVKSNYQDRNWVWKIHLNGTAGETWDFGQQFQKGHLKRTVLEKSVSMKSGHNIIV